ELKGSGTEFFITSEGGSSVRIYPMQVWSQVEERREHLCCRTKYFGQAVAMNNQGRVLIPIVLRSSAHMRGGVDLLDYLNYLEVWNHAQFLKNLKSSPITAQDKKMLSKLSCAPRFPRTIRRNKEEGHVHGTEMLRFRIDRECIRIYAVKRAKPLSGHGTLGQDKTRAPGAENTNPNSSTPSADRTVSLKVCLPR